MNKNWPKNDQKMTKKWTRIDQKMTKKYPKIDRKLTKKWSKHIRKLTKNCPINAQKLNKKWTKIDQKMTKKYPKIDRKLCQKWTKIEQKKWTKIDQKMTKTYPKTDQKLSKKWTKISMNLTSLMSLIIGLVNEWIRSRQWPSEWSRCGGCRGKSTWKKDNRGSVEGVTGGWVKAYTSATEKWWMLPRHPTGGRHWKVDGPRPPSTADNSNNQTLPRINQPDARVNFNWIKLSELLLFPLLVSCADCRLGWKLNIGLVKYRLGFSMGFPYRPISFSFY